MLLAFCIVHLHTLCIFAFLHILLALWHTDGSIECIYVHTHTHTHTHTHMYVCMFCNMTLLFLAAWLPEGSLGPASRMLVQQSETSLKEKKRAGQLSENGSSVWVQVTGGQRAVSVDVWFSVVRWILRQRYGMGDQAMSD